MSYVPENPGDSIKPEWLMRELSRISAEIGDVSYTAITDHGALIGLGDDDHLQYLTEARGDALYYREYEVDSLLLGKQGKENGFDDRADSTLSFTDATRTFQISPVGGSFVYYASGARYIKTASDTVVIGDVEGLWYIYYDGDTLSATQTFSDDLIMVHALVAVVRWDATNNEAVLLGDERHGNIMDSITHLYQHNTTGTKYGSGLAITDVTADGTGNLDAHAQIGTSSGVIWDEDIELSIPADAVPASIPLFYREGANGDWRKITATGFIVTTAGTGRAAYNEWTGAVWQLTEVANNDFVLAHLYAINDINDGYCIIIGQESYATVPAAREGAATELLRLETDGLPTVEFKSVGTLILQTSSSYSNAVKSRVRTTDEGGDYIDWRLVDVGAVLNVSAAIAPAMDDITDVTITSATSDEVLKFDGSTWINNTLAEAGIAAASHLHTGVYEPADATILKQADVDDTPVNGATTVPISSNWAYDVAGGIWDQVTGGVNYSGGNVGVGISSPTRKLEVAGNTHVQLGDTSGWALSSKSSAAAAHSGFWYTTNNAELLLRDALGNTDVMITSNSASHSYINNGGRLGLGTSTPSYTLDVVGEIRSSTQVLHDGLQVTDLRDKMSPTTADVTPDYFREKCVSFGFSDDAPTTGNAWDSLVHVKGWTDSYTSWQLLSNANNSGDLDTAPLFFRSGRGSAWGDVRTVCTVPGKVVPDTSWQTSGATNFKYRKLADGSVEIRSTNTSAKSGTLPSGYRPSESINLAVNSADSGPGDHFMSAIYITSAGVVTSASEEGHPTTGATVRFYADGS